ncbi:MAG: cyclic nucleotide-binding domain-containing protein [Amylibacter sp.]|nr:cyclic nucleotide-binding domain-containing protein [Amylibacter sp.]MDG1236307.1 cyclic nucleotide-binding domain-containing protein [Amylibacter sp.]
MLNFITNFLRFEGIPTKVVIITAVMSYLLQINAIVAGNPLYIIALYTLAPWIPLVLFEGVWKVKNYSIVAVLALFTILQIGHFAEHLIQVVQLNYLDGTVACPPPIDSIANYNNALSLGIRDENLLPTYLSVDVIAKAGVDGFPILDAAGNYITGPAACAIFGQLDLEIVHLVWELIGYFGTALVLFYFVHNVWLLIALICLSWHGVEHLTITYFYYFDQTPILPGFKQLWATVQLDGNKFMAVPAGIQEDMLNFYQAGGKFGILANDGMLEQLTGFNGMPGRPVLHMGYNLAITIPTVIGCLVELRKIRSSYLEESFSALSEEELTKLTTACTTKTMRKGDMIFEEGDPSIAAYLIKSGAVKVVKNYGSSEEQTVGHLLAGELLGEMALLDGKDRSATVICEKAGSYLVIPAKTFRDLLDPQSGDYQSEATALFIKRLADVRFAINRELSDK